MEYASLRNLRSRSGNELGEFSPTFEDSPPDSPRQRYFLKAFRHLHRAWISCKRNPIRTGVSAIFLLFFLYVIQRIGSSSEPRRIVPHNSWSYSSGRKPFIYMYEFGPEFTDDIRKLNPAFYSQVYDAERLVHELISSSNAVRTRNALKATLFYVPFYSAFYTSFQYKDWEVNMKSAVNATSQAWLRILRTVRNDFPFFNRSSGADHFSVLAMDHGRCTALTYVDPKEYSSMFFLQHNGDKMVRSSHSHAARNLQILAYSYGAPTAPDIPDIPCYRPELDIVIPPPLEGSSSVSMAITPPTISNRSIVALFDFKPQHHHGNPVIHSRHAIRGELYSFDSKAINGWLFKSNVDESKMRSEMRKSVFCVCPPGHSQWTSRMMKAILAGCIPVTFFRENDLPWQEFLDYRKFSVNIDPDDIPHLQKRLNAISTQRLHTMQRALGDVQEMFKWGSKSRKGVENLIIQSLRMKAEETKLRI